MLRAFYAAVCRSCRKSQPRSPGSEFALGRQHAASSTPLRARRDGQRTFRDQPQEREWRKLRNFPRNRPASRRWTSLRQNFRTKYELSRLAPAAFTSRLTKNCEGSIASTQQTTELFAKQDCFGET